MRLLLLKENYKGSNVQKRTSTIPFHLTYSGSSQVLVWIYWILAWTTIQPLPQQLLRIFISSVIRIELFQITFDKVWWGGQFFPLQEIDLRDSPLSQVPDFPYQGSRFKKNCIPIWSTLIWVATNRTLKNLKTNASLSFQ